MGDLFDIAVIGGGPGGYVCAIRASQLGLNVALIEKESLLGGTCLRVGCIPTKSLLDSSKLFYQINKKSQLHGINVSDTSIDIDKMMQRKTKIINNLAKGVESLIKANKIKRFSGTGKLVSQNEIEINSEEDSSRNIKALNIVLATGSTPKELPSIPFDGDMILDSEGFLSLKSIPKSIIAVGGGAIGLELSSVWSNLGSKVTVIEILPQILPGSDSEISKTLERALKKQGLNFLANSKIQKALKLSNSIKLQVINSQEKTITLEAEKILVSIGRKPFFKNLGLENLGIKIGDKTGQIEVNSNLQTSTSNVFAIGDLVRGPMLAHKAHEEGVCVAEFIAKERPELNYSLIPNIVYTSPEVASIGLSEEMAETNGIKYKTGKFHFRANARAACMDQIDGMVKLISEAKTQKCIGAHIVGFGASEMIGEISMLMRLNGKIDDIFHMVHAHPTLSESIKEAALDVEKRSIHALPIGVMR